MKANSLLLKISGLYLKGISQANNAIANRATRYQQAIAFMRQPPEGVQITKSTRRDFSNNG